MAKAKKVPATPEVSGTKQVTGKEATQFKPGQSGNPAGRPVGIRNALSKAFIRDLSTVWHEVREEDGKARGLEALRKLANERPTAFVTAVGNLVPREFDLGDKSQTAFRTLWTAIASGKLPPGPTDEGDEE